MIVVRRLAAMILLCLFLVPDSALAFIGKIRIGGLKLPCAVSCGSSGVVNPNFFGDSVNAFMTQPSIDAFGARADQSVDRASHIFSDILSKKQTEFFDQLKAVAADQRAALMADLAGVVDTATADLDDVLRENIQEADQILETRLGTLQVVIDAGVQNFSYMLQRATIFLALVASICYVLWLLYRSYFVRDLPRSAFLRRTGAVALLAVLFGFTSLGFISLSDKMASRQYLQGYESRLASELSALRLDDAVYYSEQLVFLKREDPLVDARAEKVRLIRDVFRRPALYRTPEGIQHVLSRTSAIQGKYISAGKEPDTDLNLLYAFASWQYGQDKFAEYVAACIFASALDTSPGESLDFPVMIPMASYYLQAYLAAPIPDDIIAKFYADAGESADSVFGTVASDPEKSASPLTRRFKVSELQQLVSARSVDISPLAKQHEIYAYIAGNLDAVRTYRIVTSDYVELVRLLGHLPVAPSQEVEETRAQIAEVAKSIIATWDTYVANLTASEFLETPARLNNFKSIWPIYTHALAALRMDTATSVPVKVMDSGIHSLWLATVVQPSVSPSAFKLFEATTIADFAEVDARLDKLEGLSRSFFGAIQQKIAAAGTDAEAGATAQSIQFAKDIALASAQIGLYACKIANTSSLRCADPSAIRLPAGRLFPQFAALDGLPDIERFAPFTSELVRVRAVPAF